MATNGRFDLSRSHAGVRRRKPGADRRLRSTHGGQAVNLLYLVTGVMTLALFIYLVAALLKPEWFG